MNYIKQGELDLSVAQNQITGIRKILDNIREVAEMGEELSGIKENNRAEIQKEVEAIQQITTDDLSEIEADLDLIELIAVDRGH